MTTNLTQKITNARRAISLAHASHDKDVEKTTIAELNERIVQLLAEHAKAIEVITDLTDIVEKYNIVHSGQSAPPLVSGGGKAQDVAEEHRSQMPNDEPIENTIRFYPKDDKNDLRCEFNQYDKVFHLYAKHPVSGEVLLLNGLPNRRQKHWLSGKLATAFDGLSSDDNINSFRQIRHVNTEKPVIKTNNAGKEFYQFLTCGKVFLGNCKCGKKAELLTSLEETTDGINESRKAEEISYLDGLVAEETTDGINESIVVSYLDGLAAEETTKPLTKLQIFKNTHEPDKGSKVDWQIANKAVAVMKNKSVEHKGYLDKKYRTIIIQALSSQDIDSAMLSV